MFRMHKGKAIARAIPGLLKYENYENSKKLGSKVHASVSERIISQKEASESKRIITCS